MIVVLTLFIGLGLALDPLSWLGTHGVKTDTVKSLELDGSLWMISARKIAAGKPIITTPADLVLRTDNLPPFEFSELAKTVENQLFRLSVYVATVGAESGLIDFYRSIPCTRPALFWDNLTLIQGSPVVSYIHQSRSELTATYEQLAEASTAFASKVSLAAFEEAAEIVAVRSIEVEGETSDDAGEDVPARVLVLAPGVDIPQYSLKPSASVVVDETGAMSVVAIASMSPSTQVTVAFPHGFANDALLMLKGAVMLPSNPLDTFPLSVTVGHDGENRALKSAILKAAGLPDGNATVSLGGARGEDESDSPFLPKAFIALLRVHLAQNDEIGHYEKMLKGEVVSLELELRAFRAVIDTVRHLLAGYNTDIIADAEKARRLEAGEETLDTKEEEAALHYLITERSILLNTAREAQQKWLNILLDTPKQISPSGISGVGEDIQDDDKIDL